MFKSKCSKRIVFTPGGSASSRRFAIERDRIARELAEKEEIERVPNIVGMSSLFELVAQGVMLDKVVDDAEQQNEATVMAAKMGRCFSVSTESPLDIKGTFGNGKWPECSLKGVDCPEWLVSSFPEIMTMSPD